MRVELTFGPRHYRGMELARRRGKLPSSPSSWVCLACMLAPLFEPVARADPSSNDVESRYVAIESALEQGEAPARLWWYGFTLSFAGITAGECVVAGVTTDGSRVDAAVGAGGSAIGVLAMIFGTSRAAFEFRSRLAALDATTDAGRRARLREAERILEEAADDEVVGHSWLAHVGADVVTLAGTFVLWAGYHRYASGWLNLVGGTVIGEAQILTKPTAAIGAWRAYRASSLSPSPARVSYTWSVVPSLGGASIAIAF
jgi:hypothetical protein